MNQTISRYVIIAFSIALFSAMLTLPISHAVEVFHKDELPFDKPYEYWVQEYWRWISTAPIDSSGKYTYLGPSENTCFINRTGTVVMLAHTVIGGTHDQRCEISSDEGIMIDAWSAECDGSTGREKNKTLQELLECARNYNLGKVEVKVYVDGKQLAHMLVEDLKTIDLVNVTEISTNVTNITIPKDSFLQVENPGTYDGSIHGWYIFLKPLPVGEHTVRYVNTVTPTEMGPANRNNADITYSFMVK